jgi:Ca2+-binding EF-hand superfamily protein
MSKKPRQSLDPKDLFQKADKSGNKNIDLNELDSFLTSINLKVKSDELKKLLKVKIKFSYFVSYKIVIFIFYLK